MLRRTYLINLLVQALLWFLVLATPVFAQSINGVSWMDIVSGMKYYYPGILTFPAIFYANYFVFIPKLLFAKKNLWYFIANFLFVFLLQNIASFYLYSLDFELGQFSRGMRLVMTLGTAVMNMLLILAAIGLRSQQKYIELEIKEKENQRTHAEQELNRLKDQLNPHFLFNTLNNISSLVALNQDEAQDSITRLSDMLRYVLYDSTGQTVSLEKEIDFMKNYIDLMRLRYTDTLCMNLSLPSVTTRKQIAPLLFISLLENAFKYGATSQHACHIDISLTDNKEEIAFCVKNTLAELQQNSTNKGGLGIDNLKKRLELIYPGRHEFSYGINHNEENVYYESRLILKHDNVYENA